MSLKRSAPGWAMLLLCLTGGCMPGGVKIMPVPVDRSLEEVQVSRDKGWVPDKIALIDVDGVIMNSPSRGLLSEGEHPVSFLVEKLDAARKDRRVKGVVLRINSPGGSVTASEIMHAEIMRFKKSGKPVLAMMMDVAASGGYYIACACDEIVAHPTSVTGSIGVIMQMVDVSGTLGKLGITTQAIKSGPMKDAGSPLRGMTADEHALFQEIIDQMYARFVDVVAAGRTNLDRDQVMEAADGRVYTSRQALDLGLIDRIGTLRQGIARVKELAGVERCRVITYQRPLGWHPNIYAGSTVDGDSAQRVALLDFELPSWLKPGRPHFMYLWWP